MTNNVSSKVFQPFINKEGGINKGCQLVAKKLKHKWTWKYLYHVYRGTVKPSRKLERALMKLRPPKPLRKRYRLRTEAIDKVEFQNWKTLTMTQRRNALNKAVKG